MQRGEVLKMGDIGGFQHLKFALSLSSFHMTTRELSRIMLHEGPYIFKVYPSLSHTLGRNEVAHWILFIIVGQNHLFFASIFMDEK